MFWIGLSIAIVILFVIAFIGSLFENKSVPIKSQIKQDPYLQELKQMNQFTINEQMGYTKRKD